MPRDGNSWTSLCLGPHRARLSGGRKARDAEREAAARRPSWGFCRKTCFHSIKIHFVCFARFALKKKRHELLRVPQKRHLKVDARTLYAREEFRTHRGAEACGGSPCRLRRQPRVSLRVVGRFPTGVPGAPTPLGPPRRRRRLRCRALLASSPPSPPASTVTSRCRPARLLCSPRQARLVSRFLLS